MQADSILRIHLHTHNIRLRNAKHSDDEVNITGVLHDNQIPIHIAINRYISKKYGLTMNRYTSDTATNRRQVIADYFTPTIEEKIIFDTFFTSTPLSILQQHLTKIFAQWTNTAFIEHTNVLTRLIQRIPRNILGYSNTDHRLYYQDTQRKDNTTYTYWDSLDKIHAWCHGPRFYYLPKHNTWKQNHRIDIISHIMSQYQWDEHQPLSMHETIQIIRQARALNIPSLPKDLSEIC